MIRFRKSLKLAPGVRITLGRRGASASIGARHVRVNVSKRGMAGAATLLPGITYITRRWRPTKETDDA